MPRTVLSDKINGLVRDTTQTDVRQHWDRRVHRDHSAWDSGRSVCMPPPGKAQCRLRPVAKYVCRTPRKALLRLASSRRCCGTVTGYCYVTDLPGVVGIPTSGTCPLSTWSPENCPARNISTQPCLAGAPALAAARPFGLVRSRGVCRAGRGFAADGARFLHADMASGLLRFAGADGHVLVHRY
jgi:hypothetical protein